MTTRTDDDAALAVPEGVREAFDPRRVPLLYPHMREALAPMHIQRAAESARHRARVYACAGFYKTISRCMRLGE
ncbi:hypothetical protein [Longimicrobium sp.]|uniref:hypothetical protein n=1 Tax=Longimicrobium sp. TaxID=2029185 RepID=UPI002C1979A7|nr:hypothetical protein [Longimicrobium sp.]HSU12855.1 hypothetical protein [Longimicrobium sp.]